MPNVYDELKTADGSKTRVAVNATILSVGEIDEMLMTFAVRFKIEMTWFDSRLSFNNLKNHLDQGTIVGLAERSAYGCWQASSILGCLQLSKPT